MSDQEGAITMNYLETLEKGQLLSNDLRLKIRFLNFCKARRAEDRDLNEITGRIEENYLKVIATYLSICNKEIL